jgi:hypothetical protein
MKMIISHASMKNICLHHFHISLSTVDCKSQTILHGQSCQPLIVCGYGTTFLFQVGKYPEIKFSGSIIRGDDWHPTWTPEPQNQKNPFQAPTEDGLCHFRQETGGKNLKSDLRPVCPWRSRQQPEYICDPSRDWRPLEMHIPDCYGPCV